MRHNLRDVPKDRMRGCFNKAVTTNGIKIQIIQKLSISIHMPVIEHIYIFTLIRLEYINEKSI